MSKEEKKRAETKAPEGEAIEPRYSWDERFRQFDELMENMRRDFFRPWGTRRYGIMPWMRFPSRPGRREADIDLVDNGKEYEVHVEIPGIPKDKIDVNVTKNALEISAKADVERNEEEKNFVIRERGYSEIFRHMSFPDEVLPEKAEATFKDGLLKIKIPKKTPMPEAKRHKVEIA